ncbi:YidH family protein [Planctomicrobium sp. SH661]|uniref:YidH family protein n=1 Tax=Planctomicrobium sp. SH661 TaxID=3448124 RepID=UPI003F5B633A
MTDQSDPPEPRKSALDATTALAAERTLLAWIRTGLALMGFGFVIARFGLFLRELIAADHLRVTTKVGISNWFGSIMMLLGIAVLGFSGLHHMQLIRRLSAGEHYRVNVFSFGVLLAFLLAAIGLAMTASLIYTFD